LKALRPFVVAVFVLVVAALVAGATGSARTSDALSDTGKIAFVRAGNVWVMNSDGSAERRLSHVLLGVPEEFAWSADGQRIAYVRYYGDTNRSSSQSQPSAIYVVHPDGTGLRRVSRERGFDINSITWAPDGRRLAYIRALGTGRTFGLFVTSIAGKERELARTLTPSALAAAWSPDGRWLAFSVDTSGDRLDGTYTITPDGSRRRRLTRTTSEVLEWSPDSRTLLYGGEELMSIGANGAGKRRLATDVSNPTWATDGRRIAFVRGDDIWVMDARGRGERRITSGPELDEAPSWSPDGSLIAFDRSRGENYSVYVVREDGRDLRRLTRGPYDHSPAWQPARRQ
jgi:TolB protein